MVIKALEIALYLVRQEIDELRLELIEYSTSSDEKTEEDIKNLQSLESDIQNLMVKWDHYNIVAEKDMP